MDGGTTPDGGVIGVGEMPVHEAFPGPTSALWIGTTRVGERVELHLEVSGAEWIVAPAESAPVPDVTGAGIEVELAASEEQLVLTRQSDGALLLAWIRRASGDPLEDRSVGGLELAVSEACYGWYQTPYGCGIGFLVHTLEASSPAGAVIDVLPRSSASIHLGGAAYTITNRSVSEAGGTSVAVCGAATFRVFDADVVRDTL